MQSRYLAMFNSTRAIHFLVGYFQQYKSNIRRKLRLALHKYVILQNHLNFTIFLTAILHHGLRNCFFLRFFYFFEILYGLFFPFGIFFFNSSSNFEFQLFFISFSHQCTEVGFSCFLSTFLHKHL